MDDCASRGGLTLAIDGTRPSRVCAIFCKTSVNNCRFRRGRVPHRGDERARSLASRTSHLAIVRHRWEIVRRVKLKSAYNISMATYVIKNRVPSAEEMGRKLGLSDEQVATVRFIMSSPATSKRSSGRSITGIGSKKRSAKRSTSRASGRR